jgi:hypothetical protein
MVRMKERERIIYYDYIIKVRKGVYYIKDICKLVKNLIYTKRMFDKIYTLYSQFK